MTQRQQQIQKAVDDVQAELDQAIGKHSPFNSAHEGYAVIAEELEELWEEVRKRREHRDREKMRCEAKQIAAMALRFMVEVAS